MKSVSQIRREIFLGWLRVAGSCLYSLSVVGSAAAVAIAAWQQDWPKMTAFALILLLVQGGRK